MSISLRKAIATVEGFYKPGERPQRNNNPGDLVFCPEAVEFGATRSDGRFAIFPSVDAGWEGLRRWLSVPAKFSNEGALEAGYCGASLSQVITRFAPSSENNTAAYIAEVSKLTGIHPNDQITIAAIDAL